MQDLEEPRLVHAVLFGEVHSFVQSDLLAPLRGEATIAPELDVEKVLFLTLRIHLVHEQERTRWCEILVNRGEEFHLLVPREVVDRP